MHRWRALVCIANAFHFGVVFYSITKPCMYIIIDDSDNETIAVPRSPRIGKKNPDADDEGADIPSRDARATALVSKSLLSKACSASLDLPPAPLADENLPGMRNTPTRLHVTKTPSGCRTFSLSRGGSLHGLSRFAGGASRLRTQHMLDALISGLSKRIAFVRFWSWAPCLALGTSRQ